MRGSLLWQPAAPSLPPVWASRSHSHPALACGGSGAGAAVAEAAGWKQDVVAPGRSVYLCLCGQTCLPSPAPSTLWMLLACLIERSTSSTFMPARRRNGARSRRSRCSPNLERPVAALSGVVAARSAMGNKASAPAEPAGGNGDRASGEGGDGAKAADAAGAAVRWPATAPAQAGAAAQAGAVQADAKAVAAAAKPVAPGAVAAAAPRAAGAASGGGAAAGWDAVRRSGQWGMLCYAHVAPGWPAFGRDADASALGSRLLPAPSPSLPFPPYLCSSRACPLSPSLSPHRVGVPTPHGRACAVTGTAGTAAVRGGRGQQRGRGAAGPGREPQRWRGAGLASP